MRRLLLTVVALGVAGMLVVPGAGAQVATQDSVSGSGSAWDPPPLIGVAFDFDIDAHSGPSGENPTGQVTLRLSIPVSDVVTGPVTCLVVNGNVATMNLRDPRGIATVEVTDSPSGDHMKISPSLRQPGDCSPLNAGFAGAVVFAGNLVVVDAPALPTSKDQCKNGGWRNFLGFKNEGDCVSFVATHGTNPPAGT
jgi:hypothetical protein